MKRALMFGLVALSLVAPAYGRQDRGDSVQAPRSHEIQAPVRPIEIQAPRSVG